MTLYSVLYPYFTDYNKGDGVVDNRDASFVLTFNVMNTAQGNIKTPAEI
jgi:hypothetical protein